MLEARLLTKRYDRFPAVESVSFQVRRGEVVGYLGPNGSGKSTTVKMLAGLLPPTSGAVFFDGEDVARDPIGFKRRLGYVPEEAHLYGHLSGEEYLKLVGRLRGIAEKTLARRIDALLSLFSLSRDRHASAASYSKGMRQKILISAALLHDPEVLLFDEPLSGLDVTSGLVFRHLLALLAARGKAVLYGSHVLPEVEKSCTSVVILHKGRVVANDSVTRLMDLMRSPSLEDVFTQLAVADDPVVTARGLVDAMSLA